MRLQHKAISSEHVSKGAYRYTYAHRHTHVHTEHSDVSMTKDSAFRHNYMIHM